MKEDYHDDPGEVAKGTYWAFIGTLALFFGTGITIGALLVSYLLGKS